MKNLKKYLAIAIALAMIVSMVPVTAADDTTSKFAKEANELFKLDLYRGISEKEFNPDLGSTLNRQTAAVMLLRMFGEEETAMEMELADAKEVLVEMFVDGKEVADWAAKQVAYCVEEGYVKGYPNGTDKPLFKPLNNVTGREYCTLNLNMLKYTDKFKFEEAGEKFAEVAKLSADEETAFGVSAPIKKDVLVGISHRALLTPFSEENMLLIEKLIEDGILTYQQVKDASETLVAKIKDPGTATATPAPTVVPTATPSIDPNLEKVVTVTGTNGSLTVVMDKVVTPAPVAADFTVMKKIGDATTAEAVVATLKSYDSTTKTAVLEFPPVTASNADQKVTFTVAYKKGVEVSIAMTVVAAFELTKATAVNEKVAVTGASVKPNEYFEITFSTAVDTAFASYKYFTVAKGSVAAPVEVTLSADKKVVTMKPTRPLDALADYTLTVSKDVKQAGSTSTLVTDKVFTFKTTDAVVVTSFKVGGKTIEDGDFTPSGMTGTGITVIANKNLDASTVNASTIKLFNVTDSTFVASAGSGIYYTASTKTITFVADDAENYKQYELRINGVKALDETICEGYTQKFATGEGAATDASVPAAFSGAGVGDDTYPGITGRSVIMGNSTNAGSDTERTLAPFKITVTFSGRSMNVATLTSEFMKLIETDSNYVEKVGAEVECTISYDAASYQATVVPTKDLKEKAYYKFKTTSGLKDAYGISAKVETLNIKTDDYSSPTVVRANVESGLRLAETDYLNVEFSEKMAMANRIVPQVAGTNSVDATHSVRLKKEDGSTWILASVSLDASDTTGKTYRFRPATGAWEINKTYTLYIKGKNYSDLLSASDEEGNPLAADYSVTFTTADASVPQLISAKGYANTNIAAKPAVELINGTASAPVSGIEDGAGTKNSIWLYFNRIVNNDFLNVTKYQIAVDGGSASALSAANWTATSKNDDDGDATIVELTYNATAVSNVTENRYALTVKKDMASADAKKFEEDKTVYFATMNAKPSVVGMYTLTAGAFTNDVTTTSPNIDILKEALQLTFSEKLLISSITNENIKVEDVTAGKTLLGAFYETCSTDGNYTKTTLTSSDHDATTDASIFWVPASTEYKFVKGNKYKVTFSENIKDSAYNASGSKVFKEFTVATDDAPVVTGATLTDNAVDVSQDPTFTFTFSQDIEFEAADEALIKLYELPANTDRSATLDMDYDDDTKKLTVKTNTYLTKNTQYKLTIGGAVDVGAAGNPIGQDVNYVFTTENTTQRESQITSAVWDADNFTLTITTNKPVATTSAVLADIVTGASFAGAPTITTSLDKKTIVIKGSSAAQSTVLPGVHVVSFLTNDVDLVDALGLNFKQNAANVAAQTTTNSVTITAK